MPNDTTDTGPLLEALGKLRSSLLNLTGQNRLLNFKHTAAKSLQFVHSDLDATFNELVFNGNRVQLLPLSEPDEEELIEVNGRIKRPDNREYAQGCGISCSYDLDANAHVARKGQAHGARLQTLYYCDQLGTHGRKLDREARLAIEETGANMLHLVVGFLEYLDRPGGDTLWLAPLLCVPVAIERTEGLPFPKFHLSATGEELAANLSLREKLLRDYDAFCIPEYDPETNEPASEYLARVAESIKEISRWRVRSMMTLTLLSFSNMLLLRELEPENWPDGTLEGHPLVQRLLSGDGDGDGEGGGAEQAYASEYAIDDHPRRDLPLVYDADSSQHSALIDVLDGHSRVIEGPPGTGKSQTITNLIAAAISEGKKVLFVAEKLAALEVVKSRLVRAGLGSFVLELHSTKSKKKELLEHIRARYEMRPSHLAELQDAIANAEQKHKELRAYADAMNAVLCNAMGLTVHQVLWRAERHRLKLGEHALVIQEIDYFTAPRIDVNGFAETVSRIDQLGHHYGRIGTYGASHPFWGFFPAELKAEDDFAIQRLLESHATQCEAFETALAELHGVLRSKSAGVTISEEVAQRLLKALETVTPPSKESFAAGLLPSFFSAEDPSGQASGRVLDDLNGRITSLRQAEAQCATHLRHGAQPTADALAEAELVRSQVVAMGVGDLHADALGRLAATLSEEGDRLRQGLNAFEAIANLVGMQFSASADKGRQISRLVGLAVGATEELLSFRHEGLGHPRACAELERLIAERDRLAAEQERLESEFYLDDAVEDEELLSAIRVLREGDAWYRVFQSRWRKAIRVHVRMSRDKRRRTSEERRMELEALMRYARERTTWSEDPFLRSLAGPHFAGEKTPLEQLLKSAKWNASMNSVAEEVAVPVGHLTERQILREVAQKNPRLGHAANQIKQASDKLQALVRPEQRQGTTSLDRLLDAANRNAGYCKAAAELLNAYCHDGVTARMGVDAILASAAVRQQEEGLALHAEGRSLLKEYFQGANTQLKPLLAAHAYGRLVKGAGLPPAIQQVLLSGSCVTNHAALMRHIQAVKAGWMAWRSFGDEISRFGAFVPDQWVASQGLSTSAFAKNLHEKATTALGHIAQLLPWAQYTKARTRAAESGLSDFIKGLEQNLLPSAKLVDAFEYRFYASIAKAVFQTSATFAQFSGARHNAVRHDYATLDKKIVALRGQHIANRCIQRASPPLGQNGARVTDKSEMRLLEYLFPQQRPRIPVRQILQKSGKAIQELMPCFMMGPQAVAQFLEPGYLSFDIVVMDEASQLPPAQAIGAIARGSQVVVVGDPKQLPPTSFFTGTAIQADGLAIADSESILDICMSQFRPTRQLRWHYRSQHHSLIAFSNQQFYDGKLIVFPSPREKSASLGVSFHLVPDGEYQDQMNKVEAARVVDAAVEHILTRPDDSLGIVTLNIKQRDFLDEMLDERLRSVPEAQAFKDRWAGDGMPLFVKNLETVQGDERDRILISTTFGRASGANVVRQHFGPISRDGGWRRLNVLFTRARKAIAVYSSMQPEDIVSDSSTPMGTRCLRSYLEFARDGVIRSESETDRPPDSDFEVAVIDVLRGKGYEVTPQLGVAGFRIDIAVKHPAVRSGYLAAIECDGATYHSGVSVRDRDRIRQEILESLGWRDRIWRIWSTDWFRNPRGESEKMFAFLESLAQQPLPAEDAAMRVNHANGRGGGVGGRGSVVATEESSSGGAAVLFDAEDEDLAIQVGDAVLIYRLGNPQIELGFKVTTDVSELANGFVSASDPYGEALLGASVGEHVVVRVPGQQPETYVVKDINRQTA
jgi:very-short-patch-repair endonuclease